MYTQFFNLACNPFSIAPDPHFLFMSERHREALAHLLYGIGSGGFVLLTGEIGAGKTTVCRCFLEQIPDNCNVAYIFNPKLTVDELLQSICDEFHIERPGQEDKSRSEIGTKAYVDALNAFLLRTHADGKNNVLIIDEAQSLSADVLEQLRLLTNLETSERKLLQIILIGQPELRDMLDRSDLKQLAQRVIARYHLGSLSPEETALYVQHRLAVAGSTASTPIPAALTRTIYRLTQGVPRRINLLCDRALLGAYAESAPTVSKRILGKAAGEVFGAESPVPRTRISRPWLYAAAVGAVSLGAAAMALIAYPGNYRLATVHPASQVPSTTSKSLPVVPLDLDAQAAAGADEEQAYGALAKLWNQVLAPGEEPCASAAAAGLRCYRSNKGFAEIRQLDRPVILALRGADSKPFYAVLTGLSDSDATLIVGGQIRSVSLANLGAHFHGEFATLWKTPPAYRDAIHLGDTGADVDKINSQLAQLSNETPAPANQAFDAAASRKIRAFQSAQGLQSDGLIGPKTLMQLNRATGSAEPHLHRESASLAPVGK
ncbi:MAG: AAA family ATPase [Burkholderiaceae bacterium]|nr:AAA family ATPase [Burkholderiaceae bacterium]